MLDEATVRATAIHDGAERRLNLLAARHTETMRRLTEVRDVVTNLVAGEASRGSLEDEVARSVASTFSGGRTGAARGRGAGPAEARGAPPAGAAPAGRAAPAATRCQKQERRASPDRWPGRAGPGQRDRRAGPRPGPGRPPRRPAPDRQRRTRRDRDKAGCSRTSRLPAGTAASPR